MSATGSTQEQPTVRDEEMSQEVQNLKDDHQREFSSVSDEKKAAPKLIPIPLDLVLIPSYVFRPKTEKQGYIEPEDKQYSS